MAIHISMGGPVLSNADTKPVQCASLVFNPMQCATLVFNPIVYTSVCWKVGCR